MASAWAEEETFVCSICLETMKDPATVPCGHSYCLRCIQGHWDREKASKASYSCPQCRHVFGLRPSLARSTVLVEAMEKLRASYRQSASTSHSPTPLPPPSSMPIYVEVLPGTEGPGPTGEAPGRQGSMYPQLPTVTHRACPQHQRPLNLYCRDDKESVCEECSQCGHGGHCVLTPEEERRAKQVHTRIRLMLCYLS